MKNLLFSWLLCGASLLFTHGVQAQYFLQQTNIAVQRPNGSPLSMPWTGGINTAQFSAADFNNDGIDDLLLFDRGGDHATVLLNNGTPNQTDYYHAPAYERNLPPLLHDWVLLTDANCDGIADLYSAADGANGARLFVGYYQNNQLHFTLHTPLLVFGSQDSTMVVPVYDVPAISDINSDGDLDMLSFDDAGGYVQYYENQATELALACGTQQYQRYSSCWGGFYEPGLTNVLELDHCGGGQTPAIDGKQLHPGSALLATDIDTDGDKDLILGDISFKNMVIAYNNGTPQLAHVTAEDSAFPSYTQSVNTYIFPSAYLADINNDGRKDMLVSPSARVQSEHWKCVWLYENNGQATNAYQYVSDSFLVSQTIDVNRQAKPALVDENGDGLTDIVVGNYGYGQNDNETFSSQLALWRNVGTAAQPAFRLISRNWADVQSQFVLPRLALTPTFGDLDGDGDPDMLLGDADGYLHYFKNQANADGSANMVLFQEQYAGIDVFQQNSPQLVDLNSDGLLDLVIGHHNGALQYFSNTGTANLPNFTLANNLLGKVDVRELGNPTGHATPQMVRWTDGEWRLIAGGESGRLLAYTDIAANLAPNTQFTATTLGDLGSIDVGAFAKPAVGDLNADGLPDLVVGTYNGGLLYYQYSNTPAVGINPITQQATIQLYPNPATDQLHISALGGTPLPANTRIALYDTSGKLINQQVLAYAQNTVDLPLNNLPTAIYIVQITHSNMNFVQRIVVQF